MRRHAARIPGPLVSAFRLAALAAIASPAVARAAEDAPPWLQNKPGYVQAFATALVGSGLRLNNPSRLATPLGESAESVSRTATYTDIGVAATLGNPLGVQHGIALRVSFSLAGVP